MKRILLLCFMFSTVFAFEAWAQRTVSGKLTDENGEAIPGANVVLKGTTTGTTTDLDGNYRLVVPEDGGILIFSFIGLESKEMEIGARSVIDISLDQDLTELSEVIVTAVGIERMATDLSYSVTEIDNEDLTVSRQNNVLGAIQGKVPGAQIQTASGAPGSSQKILLRGIATFTNGSGQPLIIVDGIPINNSQLGTFDGQTSLGDAGQFSEMTDAGNAIGTLEPENIESVSVLKGISAAALYGSAAANGAIIITTKSGSDKSVVSFSSSYMMESPLRLPKVQTVFGLGQYGENEYFIDDQETWGEPYDGVPRPYSQIINDQQLWKPYSPTPQSLRNAFDMGHSFKNTISFSGGNDKADFYSSYSFLDQNGIVPYTGLQRHNMKLKGGSSLKNNIRVAGSIEYTKTYQDGTPQGFGGNADAGFYGNLLRTSADLNTTEARDFNNPFYDIEGYFTPFNSNPFRAAATREDLTDWNRINGFVELGFEPTDWLNFIVRMGGDINQRELEQYRPIETAGPPNNISRPGTIRVANSTTENYNFDALATYHKNIGSELDLSVIGGLNIRDNRAETSIAQQPELGIPGFRSLNNGSVTPVVTQQFAQRRLVGAYSQVALGYQNTYHLELQGRNDWSSTLPIDNNSFFYWSASLNTILTEVVDMGPITFMKIRGSYAQVGNDAPAYSTGNAFLVELDPNVNSGRSVGYPWGSYTGARAGNTVGNAELKPEITSGFEVGVELGALNERVTLDFTYYNQLSEDQIQNVAVSGTTGFTSLTLNAGSIRNEGLEISLSGIPLESGNFNWRTRLNYTKNTNTVVSIAPGLDELPLGGLSSTSSGAISIIGVPGEPFGLFKYTDYLRDNNGNLVIDPSNGLPQLDNSGDITDGRTIQPDFMFAFINSFSYGRFKLSFNFQGQVGGYFYSQTYSELEAPGKTWSTTYNNRHPWIVPGSVISNGDGTYSPNTSIFVTNPNQYWNNRNYGDFLLSATYVKLRELSLSYDLPQAFLASTPITALTVSLVGSNLFLWTPEENVYSDPEQSLGFGVGQASSVPGFEYTPIPPLRSYGFSLRVTL